MNSAEMSRPIIVIAESMDWNTRSQSKNCIIIISTREIYQYVQL